MAVRAFPNEGDKFASKYRLLSRLKVSENLVIFRAIEIAFDRDVTLKIIRDNGDDETFSTFQKKSQSFSKLKAPFTASLFSFGREEGFLYLVLEFVEGEDLRSLQHPNPKATVDQVVNVFRQALFSLRESHGQGIIHGDLQLKNIMLVPTDETDLCIKIRDFQIVNFSGSPGKAYSEKCDIKALGHILFALLAGYQEESPNMQAVIAPIPLKRIISKMLSEEGRYENVDEVLADLGLPTLLDSLAPKRITAKKIYAVGVAFGVFIFAPLSWTSIQLISGPELDVVEHETKQLREVQSKTTLVKVDPRPTVRAINKASVSVNRASPVMKSADPILVKRDTIRKKSKPIVKQISRITPVQEIETETQEVVPPPVDEIKKEEAAEKPSFNPLKFSARRAAPLPQIKKKKVVTKKSVPKKQVTRKITSKKTAPKKAAPVSF